MKTTFVNLVCILALLSITASKCKDDPTRKIPGMIDHYEACMESCNEKEAALLAALNDCKKAADDEVRTKLNICMHVAPQNQDACINEALLKYWEKVGPCYENYWEAREACKNECSKYLLQEVKALAK